ncbi:MAG: CpsD/CapB family tyrosine-protein kinase [Negativicutes bacterium]|nr:CpsD/CapB family tyrosine-protein kinase [Negativicutes bacterium]
MAEAESEVWALKTKYQLIVQEQIKSPIAEAYRTLRTNLNFCKKDGELKTIMFTSAGPQEGKSLTTANTVVAMAQNGKKVCIVDCDLRKPVQYKIFDRRRHRGLTNILVDDDVSIDDFIQETEINNLFLLASGPIPPNPSELLGSERMKNLINYLSGKFDYVVFDAPPAIAVTDACVLAARVDGVVLVLDADTVRPEMAQKAKELIIKTRGNLLGVVLNRVEIETEHSYYYYYYGQEKKTTGK